MPQDDVQNDGGLAQAIISRNHRGMLAWLEAEKKYRSVAVASGFLSDEDIEAVHAAARIQPLERFNLGSEWRNLCSLLHAMCSQNICRSQR